jgi:hypothetical protein
MIVTLYERRAACRGQRTSAVTDRLYSNFFTAPVGWQRPEVRFLDLKIESISAQAGLASLALLAVAVSGWDSLSAADALRTVRT